MHDGRNLIGMLRADPPFDSCMLQQQATPLQTTLKLQAAGLTEVGTGLDTTHKARHLAIAPGRSRPIWPMHKQRPWQLTARYSQEEALLPPGARFRRSAAGMRLHNRCCIFGLAPKCLMRLQQYASTTADQTACF